MNQFNKKTIIITVAVLITIVGAVSLQQHIKTSQIFDENIVSTSSKITEENIVDVLKSTVMPLQTNEDLTPLINAAGKAEYVLLGEASHGTSEYYKKRAQITKRLITEKGFSLIALEADWAASYEINLYIKGQKHQNLSADTLLKQTYNRWPEWMWANKEFAELVRWLKEYNVAEPDTGKIGIYGMDMYGWMESIDKINEYLNETDTAMYEEIKQLYAPLIRFKDNPHDYVRNVDQTGTHAGANTEKTIEILVQNKEKLIQISGANKYFNAYQNAVLVKNAEMHYRAMLLRDASSWNIRARHFKQTVENLMSFYENKKIIIWAHNTHIGDARATDMAPDRVNIGQLLREKHSREKVFSVGFGTYEGTVIAGRKWGYPFEVLNVPPAPKTSFEYKMKNLNKDKAMFIFDFKNGIPSSFLEPKGHRAIGVVYNPEYEHLGNYVSTVLPERYNAFIFITRTNALTPLS